MPSNSQKKRKETPSYWWGAIIGTLIGLAIFYSGKQPAEMAAANNPAGYDLGLIVGGCAPPVLIGLFVVGLIRRANHARWMKAAAQKRQSEGVFD